MTNETKARRILEALDNGRAPIDFHWINEDILVETIKGELDQCDRQEKRESQAVGAAQDSRN